MRTTLLTISALTASLSLTAQPLRIASFDRSGNLVATNTTTQQRYSLGWAPSVQNLTPSNMITLQSRVAHSASTAFRATLEHPTMFFRVFLDPFATSDLAGDWTIHLLTSADDATDFVGWARLELSLNALGTGTVTDVQRSNGDTNVTSSTVPLTLDSDGTVGGFFPPSPVMGLDKNTIYGVMNDGGGGFDLYTWVRRAASGFATADLQGRWTMFALVSPENTNQAAGWLRFELTFDAQGNGVFTAAQRSDGTTNLPSPILLSVASDGTVSGLAPSPVMTLDKNTIWGVRNDPGGHGGYDLYVMVRRAASGFSTADAEGRWTMFMLVTRYGPPAFAGWGRHEAVIDALGNGTITVVQRSNGDTNISNPTFSFAVASDGTVGGLTPPPVMALDKNTIYAVMTEQPGGFNFSIMVRR